MGSHGVCGFNNTEPDVLWGQKSYSSGHSVMDTSIGYCPQRYHGDPQRVVGDCTEQGMRAWPKEQQDPPLCRFQPRGAPCTMELAGKRLFFPLPKGGKGPRLHTEEPAGLGRWVSGPSPLCPWGPVHRLRCGPHACEQSWGNALAADGPRKILLPLPILSLPHERKAVCLLIT